MKSLLQNLCQCWTNFPLQAPSTLHQGRRSCNAVRALDTFTIYDHGTDQRFLSGIAFEDATCKSKVRGLRQRHWTQYSRDEVWRFDAEGKCTVSQEQSYSGFAEYVGNYDRQLDFRSKAGDLLQAALTAFVCMEYVSIGCVAGPSSIVNLRTSYQGLVKSPKGWSQRNLHNGDAIPVFTVLAMSKTTQRTWT